MLVKDRRNKMALTEKVIEDKIEIVGEYIKTVQVRRATIILRDNKEISRSFHRHLIQPDADISKESANVKAICNIVHTDAVKAAYSKFIEEQRNNK
jgi:hypothetical protein